MCGEDADRWLDWEEAAMLLVLILQPRGSNLDVYLTASPKQT